MKTTTIKTNQSLALGKTINRRLSGSTAHKRKKVVRKRSLMTYLISGILLMLAFFAFRTKRPFFAVIFLITSVANIAYPHVYIQGASAVMAAVGLSLQLVYYTSFAMLNLAGKAPK